MERQSKTILHSFFFFSFRSFFLLLSVMKLSKEDFHLYFPSSCLFFSFLSLFKFLSLFSAFSFQSFSHLNFSGSQNSRWAKRKVLVREKGWTDFSWVNAFRLFKKLLPFVTTLEELISIKSILALTFLQVKKQL